MTHAGFDRRRAIVILAAAGVSPLAARAAPEAVRWRGVMLGAPCAVDVLHPDPAHAQAALDAALAQARRLEGLFSLYRADSTLSQLNRAGGLVAPEPDFLALLQEAAHCHRLTRGAFDPTVQPLFTMVQRHFSGEGADPSGPPKAEMDAALSRVGFARVALGPDRVALPQGAQLTLNGIAQGYVTDQVAAVLARAGIGNALIDMGEVRALGARPDGGPWRVGLEEPDGAIWDRIDCRARAVATSAGGGLVFDPAGRFNHIFDPRTGVCARRFRAVAVVAPTATLADALSTAFSLVAPEEIERVLSQLSGVSAHVLDAQGRAFVYGDG